MQAVILAAGLGERLGGLTKDRPKSLVRVAGTPLIMHVLHFIDDPRITERVIVTGHMAEKIKELVTSTGIKATFVHNPNFKDGSIRSIETALAHVKDDLLLMNADHIYPKRMLARVLENKSGITAICDFDRKLGPDDMKVKLNGNKKLAAIKKTLTDFDGGYIGMTFCAADSLGDYKEAVALTRKIDGDKAAVEMALGHLAERPRGVNICDASGIGWLEVDTPEDLELAERTLTEMREFLL